jgi:hypothetical protein
MFDPSRDQVRTFFIETWQKHQANGVLTPLQTIAAGLIEWHPEYFADLNDPDALQRDYAVESGRTNPFLHLSMHLAIAEQISIDHPPGIRAVHAKLAAKYGEHDAIHEIMECLGQVVWESQRLGQPLNNETYLDLLERRATATNH